MKLLEGSLAAPVLDLESGARDYLLAEAGKVRPPKVVALVTDEAWDVAAFDWLLGEHSTDAALMDRLAGDSAFATSVAEQLGFVRKLRLALRPAAPAAEVARKHVVNKFGLVRLISAGLAAAIAWMLVVTIPTGFTGGVSHSEQKSASMEKSDGKSRDSGRKMPSEEGLRERRVEGFAETPARSRRMLGGGEWLDVDSVRKGADVLEFSEATRLAARELFCGSDDGFAATPIPADLGMEVLLASSAGRPGSLSQGEHGADWMFTRSLVAAGQGLDGNLGQTTIPEPSGLFLTALGWLALMARRRRPRIPVHNEFRETRLPPRRFYGRRFPAE